MHSTNLRQALAVLLICLGVYSATNYGGVRPPDSEVVFRVAEALIDGRGFSPKDLESWPGFGVSPGRNGRLYAVYPPVESLALAPVAKAAQAMDRTGWYRGRSIPYSHYVADGLGAVMFRAPIRNLEPHALRFVVSWFDVFVSALVAAAFYAVLLLLTGSGPASFVTALFYAFGTPAFSYAGSFFSEPLALFFVLISFFGLLRARPIDPSGSSPQPPLAKDRSLLWISFAGLALGLAVATHPSAVLFAPFFFGYLLWSRRTALKSPKGWVHPVGWLVGLGIVLSLIGVYNFARFGDFLQSGRGLSAANKLVFISPVSSTYWANVYHVLLAPGKGLVLFCPAVVVGIAAWPRFMRAAPALSALIAICIAVRLLLNASYKDWHAGFSLGPRYMLLVVPFCVVPLAYWWKDTFERRAWKAAVLPATLMSVCVLEQTYFALGEIFSYYHLQSFANIRKGVDVVMNQSIYLRWSLSPLGHLHQFRRGPFLLQSLGVSNLTLWLIASAILLGAIAAAILIAMRRQRRH